MPTCAAKPVVQASLTVTVLLNGLDQHANISGWIPKHIQSSRTTLDHSREGL